MARRHAERLVESDFASALLHGHEEGVDDTDAGRKQGDEAENLEDAEDNIEEALDLANNVFDGHGAEANFFKFVLDCGDVIVLVVVTGGEGENLFFELCGVVFAVFGIDVVGEKRVCVGITERNDAGSDNADNFWCKFFCFVTILVDDA